MKWLYNAFSCLTDIQWPPETIIAVTVSGVLLLILIVVIGVWFIARSRFKKIPDRPDFTSINPDYERKIWMENLVMAIYWIVNEISPFVIKIISIPIMLLHIKIRLWFCCYKIICSYFFRVNLWKLILFSKKKNYCVPLKLVMWYDRIFI